MSEKELVDGLNRILKKYSNRKIYYNEILKFKEEFIEEMFEPQIPYDCTLRKVGFFNAVLEEWNLPYFIIQKFEYEGDIPIRVWFIKPL